MNTDETPNAVVAFGEFLKDSRKRLGLPSRVVALDAGMQPSNYCRMENGGLRPPQDANKLKLLAGALRVSDDKEARIKFYDLAARANNDVPLDLAEIIKRDDAIPLVLRTIDNRQLSKEQVEQLLDLVTGTHGKVRKKNPPTT